MLRLLPLAFLLLVLTAAAEARAQHIDRVEIIEWGIFQHDDDAVVAQPHSAVGTMTLVKNVRLLQTTTTIPALVGMKFGVRYRVVGSPQGVNVRLRQVTRFPSQGLTNPARGKTFSESEHYSNAVIGSTTYRGYDLDHDWEVEPGPWTMEIWHEGRKLAEKTFIVTRLVSSAE
jgi:Domain of unknown function (DUF3859)